MAQQVQEAQEGAAYAASTNKEAVEFDLAKYPFCITSPRDRLAYIAGRVSIYTEEKMVRDHPALVAGIMREILALAGAK